MARKMKMNVKARRSGPIERHVGQRLRLIRLEQNISQAELGHKLGLTFQQVQKYEKGVNRIPASRLDQISKIFSVGSQYFFDGLEPDGERKSGPPAEIQKLLTDRDVLALAKIMMVVTDRDKRAAILNVARAVARVQ
jgi:transcriptional regulator with XRE-family HTH domain